MIRPFDASTLKAIERAFLTSDLGLTPNNDGKAIRLNLPPLTEERRRDLVKVVHNRVEESRVAIRNVRRDNIKDLREFEQEKMISEDELDRRRRGAAENHRPLYRRGECRRSAKRERNPGSIGRVRYDCSGKTSEKGTRADE